MSGVPVLALALLAPRLGGQKFAAAFAACLALTLLPALFYGYMDIASAEYYAVAVSGSAVNGVVNSAPSAFELRFSPHHVRLVDTGNAASTTKPNVPFTNVRLSIMSSPRVSPKSSKVVKRVGGLADN